MTTNSEGFDALTAYSIIATVFIFCAIYIPLIAYHGSRYYVNRHHVVYRKRYSYIVLYEVYLSILKCIMVSIALIVALFINSYLDQIALIWNIINSIIALCLFYCWVWRFWNLHYHLQWTNNALHNQWKSLINKNHYNYQSSNGKTKANPYWYIENKKKYGNATWCRKHVIVPLLLISMIFVIAQTSWYIVFKRKTGMAYIATLSILVVLFVLPYIFLVYIYRKTKMIEDNFYIRLELKLILIFFTFEYIFSFIYYAIMFSPDITETLSDDKRFLITACSSILAFGSEVCSILVATYWVNKKVKSIINNQQFRLRKLIYDTSMVNKNANSDLLSIEFTVNSSFENDSKKRLTEKNSLLKSFGATSTNQITGYQTSLISFQMNLIRILKNDQAFIIYTKFLLYELSLENLLFCIEIIQFQKCIYYKFIKIQNDLAIIDEQLDDELSQSKMNNISTTNQQQQQQHDDLFKLIDFCDTIPVSSIVEDITNGENIDYEYNVKLAAKELYLKYVSVEAEMQINIPYTIRRELDKLFNTKHDGRLLNRFVLNNLKSNFEALLHLFDQCLREVISLMMDSYQRIETSQHFKKLRNALSYTDQ